MSWLAALGVGLNVAGAAYQYEQDRAMHRHRVRVARVRAKFQKDIAYNQAILAEAEAEDVLRVESAQQAQLGKDTARVVSRARTAMAASGFRVDGGDFHRLTEASFAAREEDSRELRFQAKRRSDLLGYRAAMIRHSADYNAKLASHDPGGPQWGGYFLKGLSGAVSSYAALKG